jgi:hypothetical protein
MTNVHFLLHRRALLAYNALTQAERDRVEAALAPLADLPLERWPGRGARKLASEKPLYLVLVDKSLRAIVRPTAGGQPEVLDLVRHETLRKFQEGVGVSANQP